ncbi:MAG: NUDIX hydrolase [Rhodobiaceae bacterium]|nr:NUDIX hydrolase [Rhodobiaceae bacterium]MCC0055539.1 NUDIX hydrolase [Rhodobiaceae bacterium]
MSSSDLRPSFSRTVPRGDNLERAVCDHCNFVHYENPRIVVGSVVRHEGKILMCRRAIEPRRGLWTLPAGFLEIGETPEAGARREAMEEANAALDIQSLLAVYTIHKLSQVQIMYRAALAAPDFSAGPESLEVRLFAFSDIPRDEIAFPSVHWALDHDRAIEEGRASAPFANPPGETGNITV